jgi:hypothetical protein
VKGAHLHGKNNACAFCFNRDVGSPEHDYAAKKQPATHDAVAAITQFENDAVKN